MEGRAVAEFLGIEELPGSVGEILARPVPVSASRRVAAGLMLLAALMFAIAALVWLFGGTISAELGLLHASTIDLSPFLAPLLTVGVINAILGVFVFVVSLARKRPKYDQHATARRAIYAQLLILPRFAVTRRTPLRDVSLRERPILGVPDASIFTARGEFSPDDFRGKRPSEFAAYDYEVINGALYVFYTEEAKRGFAARIQGKERR